MCFHRWRQLAQSEVSIKGQFVVGASLPVESLRALRLALNDSQEVSRLVFAFELFSSTIPSRQLSFLRFLGRGPIGMPLVFINSGYGSVNATHRRHLGECLPIEIESAIGLLGIQS